MSRSGYVLPLLLALVVAGCSSGTGRRVTPLTDWERHNRSPSTPHRTFTNWVATPAPTAPGAPAAPAPTNPLPPVTVAATNDSANTWISVHQWCSLRGLPPPMRLASTTPPSYAVQTAAGNLILKPGSPRVYWNGVDFGLGYAPQVFDNQLHVHSLDVKKSLLVLLSPGATLTTSSRPVVVLDPGHGGPDCGTRSILGGVCEKELVLDWALRLSRILEARGWQVLLTRTNDLDLSLPARTQIADSVKADLFLSLHFNAAIDDQTQDGLETYCLTPSGMPSNLTRGYADDLRASHPNNAFDEQNLLLAARVHRALLEVNGQRDRGVRRARFLGVLRGQQRPAILVEGGYLSNVREARLIADPAYRQKLAEAVARALSETVNPVGPASNLAGKAPSGGTNSVSN